MSGEVAAEPKEGRPEADRSRGTKVVGAPPSTDFEFTLSESRLETMRWLLEDPQALEGYAGKWVLAAGRQVRLSGDAPDELIAEAEAAGIPRSDMVLDFAEDVARVY